MNTQVSSIKTDHQQLIIQYICAFGLNAVGLTALDAYTNDAIFSLLSIILVGLGFYSCWTAKHSPHSQYAIPKIVKYILTTALSVMLYMYVMTNRLLDFSSLE